MEIRFHSPDRPQRPCSAGLGPVAAARMARAAIGLTLLCGWLGAPFRAAPPPVSATPAPTTATPPPARQLSLELLETLPESIALRRQFPFRPDCNGNTKEMLACLWRQRDRQDQRLQPLLGGPQELERWRAVRQRVCRRAAEKGSGGSIAPLLGLECELALNTSLLSQITTALVP